MTNQADECAKINNDPRPTKMQLAWKEVKWRAYLLCLRLFYRHWSRLIHRFGMHQMKRLHPLGGPVFYRCEWCGLHGRKVEVDDLTRLHTSAEGSSKENEG